MAVVASGPGEGSQACLVMGDIADKTPPRVIPLLCNDLKSTQGEHQVLHLLTLSERWEDITQVRVTTEDATELLTVLMVFVNRRLKPTESAAMQNHADSCAQEAFAVLHRIFSTQHSHSKVFVQGIQRLMTALGCDDAHFYERPTPLGPIEDYSALRKALLGEKNCVKKRRRTERTVAAAMLLDDLAAVVGGQAPAPSGEGLGGTASSNAATIASAPDPSAITQGTVGVAEGEEEPSKAATIAAGVHPIELDAAAFITDRSPQSEEVVELLEGMGHLALQDRVAGYTEKIEAILKGFEREKEAEGAEDESPTTEVSGEGGYDPNTEGGDAPGSERAASEKMTVKITGCLSAYFPTELRAEDMFLDAWVADPCTRPFAVELMRRWDFSGVNVRYLLSTPSVHIYLPMLHCRREKVYRDFICCTQRPKGSAQWGSVASIHIKTNIKKKSDIMYRFLVEGYNYGTNGVIHCDLAGYAHRKWERIGKGAMEEVGWPEGWDDDLSYSYMNGCTIDQYYSSDGYVVVRLQSRSFFCIGFGVSAWLVVPEFGAGHHLTATIHHQDNEL